MAARGGRCRSSGKLGNGFEKLAPVAYCRHADVLEIIGGQLRQYCPIDFVITKDLLIPLEPEALQPRRYVHRRLPLTLVYPPQPPGKIKFAAVGVVDLRLGARPSRNSAGEAAVPSAEASPMPR